MTASSTVSPCGPPSGSLKPEHRVVLFLRFYEDLTVDQIAERIGIRQGTVKSRLHYGLERLRQAYEA